jgi:hypothetical protein
MGQEYLETAVIAMCAKKMKTSALLLTWKGKKGAITKRRAIVVATRGRFLNVNMLSVQMAAGHLNMLPANQIN